MPWAALMQTLRGALERLGAWWRGGDSAEWLGRSGGERHRSGWRAEDFAAADLTRRGYHILGRNVRVGPGEIDIVAEHHRRLVFVEVRSREEDSPVRPSSTLTREKRRRIIRCGQAYMRRKGLDPAEVPPRYDIAEVYVDATGRPVRCDVIVAGVSDPDDE
ncbi:MAG: YraN family protein [Armatimonadota bacterium]|nr:YraN family protein [Armatimonadota bacterium]